MKKSFVFVFVIFILAMVLFGCGDNSDNYQAVPSEETNYFYGSEESDSFGAIKYDLACPNITFLVHGIGEDASIWSNNKYGFGYNEDSIVEQLKMKAGDANIFWAGVNGFDNGGVYRFGKNFDEIYGSDYINDSGYINDKEWNKLPSIRHSRYWGKQVTTTFEEIRKLDEFYKIGDIVNSGSEFYECIDNVSIYQGINSDNKNVYSCPPAQGWKLIEQYDSNNNDYNAGDLVKCSRSDFYLRKGYNNNINDSKNNLTKLINADFNKHIIVIFESVQENNLSYESNDIIYKQFDYVVNMLLRELHLYGELTPKINLIGHGRGGLINSLYAINNPNTVDSIFSIGTPFNGCDMAYITENISFDYIPYIKAITNCPGFYDCQNNNIQSLWNNTFAQNDNRINAYAISSGMDLRYFAEFFNKIGGDLEKIRNLLNKYCQYPSNDEEHLNAMSNELINDVFENYFEYQSYLDIILPLIKIEDLNTADLNEQLYNVFTADNFMDIVKAVFCLDSPLFSCIFSQDDGPYEVINRSFFKSSFLDDEYEEYLTYLSESGNTDIPEKSAFNDFLMYYFYNNKKVLNSEVGIIDKYFSNDISINSDGSQYIVLKGYMDMDNKQIKRGTFNNICNPELLYKMLIENIDTLFRGIKEYYDDPNKNYIDRINNLSWVSRLINFDDVVNNFNIDIKNFLIDLIEYIGPASFFEYDQTPLFSEINNIYNDFFNPNLFREYEKEKPDADLFIYYKRGETPLALQIGNSLRNLVKEEIISNISIIMEGVIANIGFDIGILGTDRIANILYNLDDHPAFAGMLAEIAFAGCLTLLVIDTYFHDFEAITLDNLAFIAYALYNIQAIENSPFNEDKREYTHLFLRLANNFFNAITTDKLVILHDGYNSYYSQSASGYNNIKVFSKLFSDYDLNTFETTLLPIQLPHHFQTTDPEIIQYIVDNIYVNEFYSSFVLSNLKNNTLAINGYIDSESNIDIPSHIHEKTVVRVNKAFYDSLLPNVTSVSYPSSIIDIDPLSFSSMGAIEINIASDNPYFYSEIIKDNQGNNLYCAIYRKGENNLRKELIKFIPYTANYYELPSSTEEIGKYAFADCASITQIRTLTGVSYCLKKIGHNAFDGCVMLNQFDFVALVNLEIIESQAFIGCALLASVGISELQKLQTVGDEAFAQCGITSIGLPKMLEVFGKGVFGDCSSLITINVNAENEYYKSISSVLYSFDETELIAYPAGNTQETFIMPESVTAISDSAFLGAQNIKFIQFSSILSKIGFAAFAFCSSIEEIILPEPIQEISSGAFYGCSLNSVTFSGRVTPKVSYSAFLDNNEQMKIYVPHIVKANFIKAMPQYESIILSKTTTVTFEKGNGEACENKEVPVGAFLGNDCFPEEPTRANFIFLGWYDEPNNQYDPTIGMLPLGNKYTLNSIWDKMSHCTLYALWSPKTYLIDYNIDFYIGIYQINQSECLYAYNSVKLISYTPQKEGYEFEGWFVNNELTDELPKNSGSYYIDVNIFSSVFNSTNNTIILYPKWTPKTFIITIEGEGYEVFYGGSMSFLDNIVLQESKHGHRISGWFYEAEQVLYTSSINTWNFATNATLIPQWSPINTVFLLDKGDNDIQTFELTYGNEFEDKPSLKPTNIYGYTFGGYFSQTNGEGLKVYDDNMNSVMEQNSFGEMYAKLYAYWIPITYIITLNHNNGIENFSTVEAQYYGDLPIIEKPEYFGHTFLGYYANNDIRYYDSQMIAQRKWYNANDGFFEARWTKTKHHILFHNSSMSKVPYSISDEEQTFLLTDDVKDGYKFLGWFDSPESENRINSITIAANTFPADIDLYARWRMETYYIYNSEDDSIMFAIHGDDLNFKNYLINLDEFSNELGQTIIGASINNKQYFKKVSHFDPEFDYEINDMVFYNEALYKCVSTNSMSTTPESSLHWSQIPIYYFNLNNAYSATEIVRHNNILYQCLKNSKAIDVNNTSYWQKLGDNIGYWICEYNYLQDAQVTPIKSYIMDDKLLINFNSVTTQTDKEIIAWGEGENAYIRRIINYDEEKFDYNINDKVYYKGMIYQYICSQSLPYIVYPNENNNMYWEKIVSDYNSDTWYDYGDIVLYNNKLYQYVKDNSIYKHSIEESNYWQELGEYIGYVTNDYCIEGEINVEPIWRTVGEKVFIVFDTVPTKEGQYLSGLEYEDNNYIKMVVNYYPEKLDYRLGDVVTFEGKIYKYISTEPLTVAIYPNENQIFWSEIPIDEYRTDEWYSMSDMVFYNDSIYQCIKDSLYQHSIFDTEYWQVVGADFGYWNTEFDYVSISWQSNDDRIDILWEDECYAIEFYCENGDYLGFYSIDYYPYIVKDLSSKPSYYKDMTEIGSLYSESENEKLYYRENGNVNYLDKQGHIYKYVFALQEDQFLSYTQIDDFSNFIEGKGAGVLKLKIKWFPANFYVNLYVQEGSIDNINFEVTYYGKYHSIPSKLTDEIYTNYDFIGWYDNLEFNGDAINNDTIVTKFEEHTLYARLDMDVIVNDNNDTAPYFITTTYGKKMPYFIPPIREGYEFCGYVLYEGLFQNFLCYDSKMNSDYYWDKTGSNYILSAYWTPIPYNIRYILSSEEKMIEGINYPNYYNIESFFTLPDVEKKGYEFMGWYSDKNSSILTIENMTGDIVLYPKFRGNLISVKLLPDDTCPDEYIEANVQVGILNDLIFTDTPEKKHHRFIGWYLDGIRMTYANGRATEYWNMTQYDNLNVAVLKARWELDTYNITFDEASTGIIYIQYGEIFPNYLTAPTREFYDFEGYYYNDIRVYFSDMTSNEECSNIFFDHITTNNNNIILKAKWVASDYTVKYLNRMGSFMYADTINLDNVSNFVLFDASIYYLNLGYAFQGCFVKDDTDNYIEVTDNNLLFFYIKNQEINIYLKALRLIIVNSGWNYITEDSEIRLNESIKQSYYSFYINSDVKEVNFIGYEYCTYEKFKIVIYDRKTPLTLLLNNLKVTGNANDSVIESKGNNSSLLDIICKGMVSIKGDCKYKENLYLSALSLNNKDLTIRSVTDSDRFWVFASGASWLGEANGNAISGGNGILCQNLTLDITHFHVFGGDGSNGQSGVSFGAYGPYPDLGKAEHMLIITSGKDGKHGKDGKDAGDGGIAIICTGTIIKPVKGNLDYIIKGGDGGDGGDGQNGQDGQDGMDGCDGILLDTFATEGGNGGKGGNGGNGGKSGIGGIAVWTKRDNPFTKAETPQGNDGTQGNGGERGGGGAPGRGGITIFGTILPDGDPGGDGKPGELGNWAGNEHVLYEILKDLSAQKSIL